MSESDLLILLFHVVQPLAEGRAGCVTCWIFSPQGQRAKNTTIKSASKWPRSILQANLPVRSVSLPHVTQHFSTTMCSTGPRPARGVKQRISSCIVSMSCCFWPMALRASATWRQGWDWMVMWNMNVSKRTWHVEGCWGGLCVRVKTLCQILWRISQIGTKYSNIFWWYVLYRLYRLI